MKIINALSISVVLVYENIVAMNSDFLKFVCAESTNLETARKNIVDNKKFELSEKFEHRFGKCFDGETVSFETKSCNNQSDNDLFVAAQIFGIKYLEDAKKTSNIKSAENAIAFFSSIPPEKIDNKNVTDQCYVNYVDLAKEEKKFIEKKEALAEKLELKEFFE